MQVYGLFGLEKRLWREGTESDEASWIDAVSKLRVTDKLDKQLRRGVLRIRRVGMRLKQQLGKRSEVLTNK